MDQSEVNVHVAVGLGHLSVLREVLQHPDVASAVSQARAAGIPFLQILLALLPIIASILGGGAINWQAIIAAILALFNPPVPLVARNQ